MYGVRCTGCGSPFFESGTKAKDSEIRTASQTIASCSLIRRPPKALREHGYHLNGAGDWTEKNKRAGAVFIEHALQLADFMTGLEVACRTRADVELIREREILAMAPEKTRTAREPLRWSVDKLIMGRRETRSVVPDGLFGLRFPDDTAAYFVLEVDRGTIPISRTGTAGSSAWRKNIAYQLATYYEGWKSERHIKQFGLKQMRVAVVTSSAARVEHMLAVVDGIREGRRTNFFLFADKARFGPLSALDAEWTAGRGDALRLVE
jgi:hypothetical protein